MFKTEKMRACAPLLALFFAQQAITADQTKTPAPTPLPNAVAATPVHPAVSAPNPPAPTQLNRPLVTTDKPTADKSTNTLTNLPASKRLAISVLAGVLTLIAALWIGARRD